MGEQSAKRFGAAIFIHPDKYEEYKTLHDNIWPEVLQRLKTSNIRNYTVYYCDKLNLLFSHLEYIGSDFAEDVKAISSDLKFREWWKICEPHQKPIEHEGKPPSEGGQGNWWYPCAETWHDGLSATSYKS